MAPQLEHPRLEGDTGPGGVLLEDHGQGLALEVVLVDVVLGLIFQLVRRVQDGHDVLLGQVQQLEQVFFHGEDLLNWCPRRRR